MKALILQDDSIIAKDIEYKILNNNFAKTIKICSTLEDALKILEVEKFDICFIDIKINDTFIGFEIGKFIRQNPDAVIICITGHCDDETLSNISKTRPDGLLIKPFSDQQFTVTTKLALKKYQVNEKFGNIKLKFTDGVITESKVGLSPLD